MEATTKATTEISKIQDWSKVTLDDTQECKFQAEVNEVYQCYGKYLPLNNQFGFHRPPRNRFQGNKFQQSRNSQPGGNCFNTPRQYSLRHQNTTVANQAYIFNRTTAHPSVNYSVRQLQHGTNESELGTPISTKPIPATTLQLPIWYPTTNAKVQQLCTN